MSYSVYCTVKTAAQASDVVSRLKTAGFSNQDVSVLMSEGSRTREFAVENQTKAPEGAAAGAGAGALLGGVLGWLTGIGTLAIPGLGPFIAAGPIMAALSGAAVGGTLGGITGGLVGLGIPEYEAKKYEGKLKGGSTLISAHAETSEGAERAREIFKAAGAEDVSTAYEMTAH